MLLFITLKTTVLYLYIYMYVYIYNTSNIPLHYFGIFLRTPPPFKRSIFSAKLIFFRWSKLREFKENVVYVLN
jgi:hypothetical protein